MPGRLPSPALSDGGPDISNVLSGQPLENASDSENDGLEHVHYDAEGVDAQDAATMLSDSEEDDEAFIAARQAASNRKTGNIKSKSLKKGGGFQSMGLNTLLLKSITRKGFSVPTPIQRKTIPLILDGQDVVGMARTGSGKTAAFVIPMLEKLKAHSVKVGTRAIIMSPSRELALQTMKAVKEFGRGTDLRSVLLVGGDSLEEQFGEMTSNPDIIIATPGRFLHLLVEMSLDLSSVRYVVFDEADRLFEMGFANQLAEILHKLPPSRQTMLFSATLPKTLVEFAKAGLKDPTLIRLDADSKMSPDLESVFLAVKSADKEGALLHLLSDVVRMPLGEPQLSEDRPKPKSKKRKRDDQPVSSLDPPTAHSTIVFAATKHHVEYLTGLLKNAGYAASYVYGSLDQTARKAQVDSFRGGRSNVLVVTDVAARGIDIPMLANVVNYDFPSQPKIFVHRVGRTARAGRRGRSYSFVQDSDLPYVLDLQLFLGRTLTKGLKGYNTSSLAEDVTIGTIPRSRLEPSCEFAAKLLEEHEDLAMQKTVAAKGEKLYTRTRNSASAESAKRAKTLAGDHDLQQTHVIYKDVDVGEPAQDKRAEMLSKIGGFRPAETVFEIGKRGVTTAAGEALKHQRDRLRARKNANSQQERSGTKALEPEQNSSPAIGSQRDIETCEESALGANISDSESDGGDEEEKDGNVWQDSEHFMSYKPREANMAEDRGYGVQSGSYNTAGSSNFVDAARGATMDLANDESRAFGEPSRARQMRWDKRSKKYVSRANDEDGSKGAKMITGESGQKLAATFRSGRFDAWRKTNRVERMPRIGEQEKAGSGRSLSSGKKYKHYAERAPKQPDKYRDDYYAKKKKLDEAKQASGGIKTGRGRVQSEVRGVEDIRKQRELQRKRKDKNARPSRKRK